VEICKKLLLAIFDICMGYFIVNVITYCRAGQLVPLDKILFGEHQFVGGLFKTKRSLSETQITCWFLLLGFVFVTFAKGIAVYLFEADKNKCRYQVMLYTWFSVLLFGMETYPMFKSSHPYNVTPVIYLVMIMAVIWANDYEEILFGNLPVPVSAGDEISGYSDHSFLVKVKWYFILMLLSVIGYSLLSEIASTDDSCYEGVEIYLPETLGFIKEHIDHVDGAELLMINSTYMYCMLGTWDKSCTPAVVDWFGCDQVDRMLDYISHTDKNIVIDTYALLIVDACDTGKRKDAFDQIVSERYKPPIISENGNLRIYNRKVVE